MTIEIHPLAIVVALPGDVFIRFIIDTYSGKTLIDVLGLEYYRGKIFLNLIFSPSNFLCLRIV